MGEVLRKFGRYFLLDQIAQGGMAEIYRARMASLDGAGRLLVIKRIQAGYGANAEFLQMFKSEIKVTMGFNHPNIVQLYDFGEEQEQPYIAMEHVDGRNLRQFLTRFNELKQTFPIDLATFIIEQAASGLHYAHSFRDKITGEALNIVHRDISPQNVLIAYEGSVKVIDFGIAKASVNQESTRAGVIKGKPSYLSPEQINGEPLDARCDIFALGTVLWELLTGKKLFAGENDLAVLKLIESCSTHVKPPSVLNPQVPKELDAIVLKSLQRNRDKRFQTAEEMQRALHRFLYAYNPEFNPSDLAYYAKDLFKNEIVEDRKRVQRLSDKVEALLRADLVQPTPTAADPLGLDHPKKEDTTTIVEMGSPPRPQHSVIYDAGPPGLAGIEIDKGSARASGVHLPSRPQGSTQRSRAAGTQGGRTRNTGSFQMQRENGGMAKYWVAAAAVAVVAVGYFGRDFGLPIPSLPGMKSETTPETASVQSGSDESRLLLEGDVRNVTVSVNGQKVAGVLPATIKNVPPNTAFKVTVVGEAGTWEKQFVLQKGERVTAQVKLSPEGSSDVVGGVSAISNGPKPASVTESVLLKLDIQPCGAASSVLINGKPVDPRRPAVALELGTSHSIEIERPGFKSYRRDFTLDPSTYRGMKEYSMPVRLELAKYGLVTIRTTPSSDAIIDVNGVKCRFKTPMENERFAAGDYPVTLVNDALGMEGTLLLKVRESKSVVEDDVRLRIKN